MYTFSITYDRHQGLYGYRTHSFPDKYDPDESSLNYANDPDWMQKLQIKRVNLKRFFFFGVLLWVWVRNRVAKVEEYDRIKRVE